MAAVDNPYRPAGIPEQPLPLERSSQALANQQSSSHLAPSFPQAPSGQDLRPIVQYNFGPNTTFHSSTGQPYLRQRWAFQFSDTSLYEEPPRLNQARAAALSADPSGDRTHRNETGLCRAPVGHKYTCAIFENALMKQQVQSITLWLTFAVFVVASIPLSWIAYKYSEHLPGRVDDSDFWFLLISTIYGMANTMITMLGLWKRREVQKRMWLGPSIVALSLTGLSPGLYIAAAKEWGAFVSMAAAAVQAFMILQLSIERDDGRTRDGGVSREASSGHDA